MAKITAAVIGAEAVSDDLESFKRMIAVGIFCK